MACGSPTFCPCQDSRPADDDRGRLVYAQEPIPAMITDQGATWPGLVLGWQGDRCYVTYNSGVGLKHLTWVRAEYVKRV